MMASPAPAVTINFPGEEPVRIDVEPIIRVLIVDDDPKFRLPLKEVLEPLGYEVDTVGTPEEAEELLKVTQYHLVIADVVFENSQTQGDDFIVRNMQVMAKAKVVAITGKGSFNREAELIEMGVLVLQKGEYIPKLKRAAAETREHIKDEITARIQTAIDCADSWDRPRSLAVPMSVIEELQKTIIDWLSSRSHPDQRSILYRGRAYSANDLIEEIKGGTEVGQAHLKMLVNLFKESVFKV